jgi:hypothetical protein
VRPTGGRTEPEAAMYRPAHDYLTQARKDDARRAGDRDRLLLEVRRTRLARRAGASPGAPVRRWARLLARRATA